MEQDWGRPFDDGDYPELPWPPRPQGATVIMVRQLSLITRDGVREVLAVQPCRPTEDWPVSARYL
jgi:hypothetical protein